MWRERYTSFGQKLINPSANKDNTGYTSHIDDASSGLTYMQARYYDPNIGRFLVNDPVGFAEGGPAYFNRYAYVNNNPVNNWDPFGLACHQVSENDRGSTACDTEAETIEHIADNLPGGENEFGGFIFQEFVEVTDSETGDVTVQELFTYSQQEGGV